MDCTFPRAAREYDRSLRGSMPLLVTAGELPRDLRGFVYVVAPTGRPLEEDDRDGKTPFLNGDGTIYRIDLGPAPALRWALTKPPCYWAERALPFEKTDDWGVTRLFDDRSLGGRNLLNTALQGVRFGADHERLLVTYESGRPFEVDPESLEVLTPVGRRDAWLATLKSGIPFELVAGTSHPAFDPERDATGAAGPGTLFVLNFVRDADLYFERLLRFLGLDADYVKVSGLVAGLERGDDVIERDPTGLRAGHPETTSRFWAAWRWLRTRLGLVDAAAQLLFWSGDAEPERVKLVGANGEPLALRESAHQMGVTEHYVVCIDAAFKFEMDLVLPDLDWMPESVLKLLRRRLSRIQPQSTTVHLVPRASLVDGATVEVVTVVLPRCSCVHFFVDHADAGGTKVVFYAIDNAATDSSEFLLDDDEPAFSDAPDLPREVHGMIPCGVDVDRLVRFEIDVADGVAVARRAGEVADVETMWTVALATGPTQFTAQAPGPITDLYFFTHGLIPSAVSRLIWELYQGDDYRRRIVPLRDVEALAAAGGVPARLCRYDATRPHALADSYEAEPGWLVLSPQCVPGGTRGYVVTTAFSDTQKQIWIFDGADLRRGPVCRLAASAGARLPWGYTLHTTYLEEAHARPPGGYRVTVRDDLVGVSHVPAVVTESVLPYAYDPDATPPPGPDD